jgi:hypothetical protein
MYKFSAELNDSDIARKATAKIRMYLHRKGFDQKLFLSLSEGLRAKRFSLYRKKEQSNDRVHGSGTKRA